MITTSDAMQVMLTVQACHLKTAPRMDDAEVALATAGVWAELFDGYDFTAPELVAAVKARARVCPDAPEAADIIRVARAERSDRMAREVAPQIEPEREHFPGDAKAAPDPAPDRGEYPAEWTSEQRVNAYWYALRLHAIPLTTAGWRGLGEQMRVQFERRAARVGGLDG